MRSCRFSQRELDDHQAKQLVVAYLPSPVLSDKLQFRRLLVANCQSGSADDSDKLKFVGHLFHGF
jgi:hypothetical protein